MLKSLYKSYFTNRAFSLIELSIVTVIIALLAVVIFTARKVILSSQLVSTIAEISRLEKGIIVFRDSYDYLPGDFPKASNIFGCTSCNGDGDNSTEGASSFQVGNSREIFMAFLHLEL